VLGEPWVTASIVLTGIAGALLLVVIVPAQRDHLGTR
jgi:hypothetical protein